MSEQEEVQVRGAWYRSTTQNRTYSSLTPQTCEQVEEGEEQQQQQEAEESGTGAEEGEGQQEDFGDDGAQHEEGREQQEVRHACLYVRHAAHARKACMHASRPCGWVPCQGCRVQRGVNSTRAEALYVHACAPS